MAIYIFAGRALLVASIAAAAAAEPSLEGRWQVPSEFSDVPAAIVRFDHVNGEYRGTIISIPSAQGEEGKQLRCTACGGARRNRPLLEMEIIWGLKRKGLQYTGGSALDPETGEIHRCSVTMAANGRELRVRYFIDTKHEGVSEVWTREPPAHSATAH